MLSRSTVANRGRKALGLALALSVIASLMSVVATPSPAEAIPVGNFDPGNIISDAVFFDGSALDGGGVQSFLNSVNSQCQAGYTCLKDYRQDTTTRAPSAGRCSGYDGRPNESAATIIARVGIACGVSQKALLVMLEKEQGLVTSRAPSETKYRIAMGYGCPDTAACDTTYYGFFNQVYSAARQFKTYAATPTQWNHVAGRVNQVRYHPNAACGSSAVFIQNQATAGLYNYTPYQPNNAALANLYGTGDGCSSYGNRNFWRLFSDWFGPGSSVMVRTLADPTLYLLTSAGKHAIPSYEIWASLSPLGSVAFVSQNALDQIATKQPVGRIIRNVDGAMYLFDNGWKFALQSCELVVHWGGACADTGYIQLTNEQVSRYVTGAPAGRVATTVSGKTFAISDGVKREVLDAASASQAGLPASFGQINESLLGLLPLGAPVVRNAVFVYNRTYNTYWYLANGNAWVVDSEVASTNGVAGRIAGTLDAASIARLRVQPTPVGSTVIGPDGVRYLLGNDGRRRWDVPMTPGGQAVSLAQGALDLFADKGTVGVGSIVKSGSAPNLYYLSGSAIRPITSFDDLYSTRPVLPLVIHSLTTSELRALPAGPQLLGIGSLVTAPGNPTVYMVDGFGKKIPLSIFDPASAMGLTRLVSVPAAALANYATSGALDYGVICGGSRYVGSAGSLHLMTDAVAARYTISYTPLEPSTCANIAVGAPADRFVRVPSGTIYVLEQGSRRPIGAYQTWIALGGTIGNTLQVSETFAARYPVGQAY